MTLLGVDTGGTFTDFVLCTERGLTIHKCLSTPDAPERAILQGIDELGLEPGSFTLVHGSTVATNAVLEGKGVRTAYITNTGFTDVLTLGRQARRELYNLTPDLEEPPVGAELCFGIPCRRDANGQVVMPLTETAIDALVQELERAEPQALAINLLFSYLAPEDEQRLKQRLGDKYFVSCSADILPAPREYERGIATWLNAYVGPLMQSYLGRLQDSVETSPLAVMQSSGGTIAAELAGEKAVNLLLSGPAGGMMAAQAVAQRLGVQKVLTFDMGGTSTDVSSIDGGLRLSNECQVAGYPVAVPMVDIHTIGAGGGSLAAMDAGGALTVGPESAGASPGPACYGQGGQRPTVTDSNVVLGRLPSEAALGGSLRLDREAAEKAFQPLASAMGESVEKAAEGVRRLANEHMAQALRVISVQRGEDPREYALMAFGGAAGLHVCALAEALEMTQAIVPANAGVLSAMGMVVAPPSRDLSLAVGVELEATVSDILNTKLAELRSEAAFALRQEGQQQADLRYELTADCRFQGQSHSLSVLVGSDCLPVGWRESVRNEFMQLHQRRYGHALDLPVELAALRLRVTGKRAAKLVGRNAGDEVVFDEAVLAPQAQVAIVGQSKPVSAYQRDSIPVGGVVFGPAVILESVSTTFVDSGWKAEMKSSGDLLLCCGG